MKPSGTVSPELNQGVGTVVPLLTHNKSICFLLCKLSCWRNSLEPCLLVQYGRHINVLNSTLSSNWDLGSIVWAVCCLELWHTLSLSLRLLLCIHFRQSYQPHSARPCRICMYLSMPYQFWILFLNVLILFHRRVRSGLVRLWSLKNKNCPRNVGQGEDLSSPSPKRSMSVFFLSKLRVLNSN